ncbi:Surfeit locus 6 domain-containing protein [Rozella allomycis CSF55]|uniref:Surfeit locus 6 domain-containing protein n=1 Tax=Rozella allomycis (strain CSF55) TaxID=988480 RepID=A0A075AS07_ROZAC|nr:Surfeit locus 6 domain-containing protein [Rozella allomycis CSF55]|eukprot:EPZ33051.1 Surfeit locus 6 domain-containing protein [Rozella allomycis CSF55]
MEHEEYFLSMIALVPPAIYFNEEKETENLPLSNAEKKQLKKIKLDPELQKNTADLLKEKESENNTKTATTSNFTLSELQEKLRVKLESIKVSRNVDRSVVMNRRKQPKRKVQNKQSKAFPAEKEQTKAPITPPRSPVTDENNGPIFNKFDFGKDKKKKNVDPLTALRRLEKEKEKLSSMDPEQLAGVKEKQQWQKAMQKINGEKVKDDEALLKKAIKRKEKQKEKSSKLWKERKELVEKQIADRQKKRQDNIQKKINDRKDRKRGRAGFEGGMKRKKNKK